MSEQLLREAFEARMTDNGKWPNAITKGRNGCYLLAQTENAWAEWQACAEFLSHPAQSEGGEVAEAGEIEAIDTDEDGQESAWITLTNPLPLGTKLYTAPPASQEQSDAATSAGTQAAMGHLSGLVDEATGLLSQLRTMVDDMHKQWSNGGPPERGEFPLLDSVDDWLGARPSQEQAQQPFQWPDSAVLAVLLKESDGSFGEDDIQTTRRFLLHADAVRAQFATTKPQAQAQELPEPHAIVTSKLGTLCSFHSSEARKGDAIFTADQMREYARAALAAKQERKPMSDEQVKHVMAEAGYYERNAGAQSRADFINGIRHCEDHHGIVEKGAEG